MGDFTATGKKRFSSFSGGNSGHSSFTKFTCHIPILFSKGRPLNSPSEDRTSVWLKIGLTLSCVSLCVILSGSSGLGSNQRERKDGHPLRGRLGALDLVRSSSFLTLGSSGQKRIWASLFLIVMLHSSCDPYFS